MNCSIMVYQKDRAKFIEVVEIAKKEKNANFQIVETEQGFDIEYERPQQLFMLGRIFQPYKPADKTGSLEVRYNNNYINNI